jgi:hypothetical protein
MQQGRHRAALAAYGLMQRAEKTERYGEFNDTVDAVSAAYDRVAGATRAVRA